jgi:hypothetical protein
MMVPVERGNCLMIDVCETEEEEGKERGHRKDAG